MILKDLNIEKSWTLFLDRDGVINKRIVDDYVKSWEQFEFLDGSLSSFKIFAEKFGRIFIITNQQGVGKGLMTKDDVVDVHNKMKAEIENNKGRIDSIYFCPDLENKNSKNRKPETGMAQQAKNDFPEIIFEKSIMLGDSKSDMDFGKRLNMKTVFISDDKKLIRENAEISDFVFGSLLEFSKRI